MRVVFHGQLATLCPEVYDMRVASVQEAIYAIVSQVPALQAAPNGERYPCRVMGFETIADLYRPTSVEEIHVFPDYTVGKSGWVRIGIGAVLMVVGAFTGNAFLFNMGLSMALGGILQLLAPQPKRDTNNHVEASRYLGSPKNTVEIGTRIPIGYGIFKLHGHYLSYDVNVVGTNPAGE